MLPLLCLLFFTGSNELYKNGIVPLKLGLAWVKGIEISQCHHQHHDHCNHRNQPLAAHHTTDIDAVVVFRGVSFARGWSGQWFLITLSVYMVLRLALLLLLQSLMLRGFSVPVQCPVMKYHRELLISILHSRVSVAEALNVEVIPIEAAPDAYKRFSSGEPVKFVLDPCGLLRSLGGRATAAAESKAQE